MHNDVWFFAPRNDLVRHFLGSMIDEADDTSLAISFNPDMRNANVRIRERVMTAKLYDLPTIVEVRLCFFVCEGGGGGGELGEERW